jgi:hypothetical protein
MAAGLGLHFAGSAIASRLIDCMVPAITVPELH